MTVSTMIVAGVVACNADGVPTEKLGRSEWAQYGDPDAAKNCDASVHKCTFSDGSCHLEEQSLPCVCGYGASINGDLFDDNYCTDASSAEGCYGPSGTAIEGGCPGMREGLDASTDTSTETATDPATESSTETATDTSTETATDPSSDDPTINTETDTSTDINGDAGAPPAGAVCCSRPGTCAFPYGVAICDGSFTGNGLYSPAPAITCANNLFAPPCTGANNGDPCTQTSTDPQDCSNAGNPAADAGPEPDSGTMLGE